MRTFSWLSIVISSVLAAGCGGSVSATDEAGGAAGSAGTAGAAGAGGSAGTSGASANGAGAAGSGAAGTPGTASCGGPPCPHYQCTCAQPTPGLGGSGCDSDHGCNTGAEVCTPLCESYGGFVSAAEAPWAGSGGSTGAGTGTSGAICVGTGAPCSDCIAKSCCDEMAACDGACNAISACVALQCPDDFATCAVSCNPQQNAAFAAYAACIVANDCAAKCDAEK